MPWDNPPFQYAAWKAARVGTGRTAGTIGQTRRTLRRSLGSNRGAAGSLRATAAAIDILWERTGVPRQGTVGTSSTSTERSGAALLHLGHRSVRAAMIYAHVLNREALGLSPLDSCTRRAQERPLPRWSIGGVRPWLMPKNQ